MRLSAEDVLRKLDESQALPHLEGDWSKAMDMLPAGTPVYLDERNIRECAEFCALDESVTAFLLEAAGKVLASPDLKALSWCVYWKLCLSPERMHGGQSSNLPTLEKALGAHAGAFYLLIALGLTPFVRLHHKSMGAPESATRETMLEFKSLMDNYARAQGGIGIFTNQLYWPGYYIGGNIFFRVGRFEYWIRRYDNKNVVVVYKNKRSGQTVALLNTREPHTKDGFRDSPAVRSIKEDYWVPSPIENDGSFVSGTPVSPDGRALRKTVRLPLSEWSCVMDKDSVMLDMHIPAGGGMSLDICVDSFRRARDFFRAQFPALNPVAVNCHSWIFSPNLPEFMPENSNLVQLMRECYLYPTESGKRDGLWFFFYQKNFDLATAPRKTSLQRTVAEHLERGGDLRSGGMFFLLDDLDNFGQQYYARNFPSGF